MAKATKRSTALKSGSPRRTTKKAAKRKKGVACPVLALAKQQVAHRCYRSLTGKIERAAAGEGKDDLEETRDFIADAMFGTREAVSHMYAESRDGAVFQLLLLYLECRWMEGASGEHDRKTYFRRAERLLFSLRRCFTAKVGAHMWEIGADWHMPLTWNPHLQVREEVQAQAK